MREITYTKTFGQDKGAYIGYYNNCRKSNKVTELWGCFNYATGEWEITVTMRK